MVSKKSLQKFLKDVQKPSLTLKESLKLPGQALELDISLSTLPSVIVPMPENLVKKLRDRYKW